MKKKEKVNAKLTSLQVTAGIMIGRKVTSVGKLLNENKTIVKSFERPIDCFLRLVLLGLKVNKITMHFLYYCWLLVSWVNTKCVELTYN
jgi:hypothetical protein